MRYRIDLILNPGKEISIFRQTLTNNSNNATKITLTNITKNELIRGVDYLISNSDRLISEGIMPEGRDGIVDFKIYDNPKRIGGRRNITFTSSINKDDYICKFVDSAEENKEDASFLDLRHSMSSYLRYAGNPDIILKASNLASEDNVAQEEIPAEEAPMDEATEEIIEETPVEEIVKETVEELALEVENIQDKKYFKGEDGKFYCPFEDCEKHKEGYATERGMKNHMASVHGIEC